MLFNLFSLQVGIYCLCLVAPGGLPKVSCWKLIKTSLYRLASQYWWKAMFNCAKFSWKQKQSKFSLVSSNPSVIISVRIQVKFRSTVAWENSRHLATPPLVFPRMTSEKRVQKFHTDDVSLHGSVGSASDWSCRVGNFLPPIRSTTPDLGSDTPLIRNFCARSLRRHFAGKPVVASRNVGFFLRLD